MKSRFLFCALLLFVGMQAQTVRQPSGVRATEILTSLAQTVRALDAYEVKFAVQMGETEVKGECLVAGERYYLKLDGAEVYGDATTRHEVDPVHREVTIVPVDTASRNILDNPATAFDLVGGNYTSELLFEDSSRAEIRLTPTAESGSRGVIKLCVSLDRGVVPRSILYDYDGEQIAVDISLLRRTDAAPRTFAAENYLGYEFIDFR